MGEDTLKNVARLPPEVRDAAHVFENAEVAWPNDSAEAAINALADLGCCILGLDARTLYPDGAIMEIPISDCSGDIEHRRGAALEALPFAVSEGTHVLITWR